MRFVIVVMIVVVLGLVVGCTPTAPTGNAVLDSPPAQGKSENTGSTTGSAPIAKPMGTGHASTCY